VRVAFDIGGTFTDVVFIADDGKIVAEKTLSLLDRVGNDIVEILRRSHTDPSSRSFVHGTTIGSNAVIEGKTAPTALITTRGFRDVLEMRDQRRPDVHDVHWDRSPALIPRRFRFEVDERILGDSTVSRPLDRAEAVELMREIGSSDLKAVAVCLVNSYLNPEHEEILADAAAEVAPDIALCLSSREFPQMLEYPRSSTTAVNASLMPVVDDYLTQLESQLDARGERLLIMQSNGGLMNSKAVRERPVQMIESGPAAGVLAAAQLASELALPKVLAFDMGGTTAKASTILDGAPVEKPEGEVAGGTTLATRFYGGEGHVIRVPSFDIVEVGAGGGSLAWIDRGGALRVGPEGAGADPGPVCYSNGGTRPTVTDANLVLGYLPSALAGGKVELDRKAAWDAIGREIAEPLGISVHDAALGIVSVANATMMRALRAVSVEKGQDPRELSIVAYGGSGPVHAVRLAESLGIQRVYVPPTPGVFSTVGLLLADYRLDSVRSVMAPLEDFAASGPQGRYRDLEQHAMELLLSQGVDPDSISFRHEIELKYMQENHPLTVELQGGFDKDFEESLRKAFSGIHDQTYGYDVPGPIEVSSIRVQGSAAAGSDLAIAEMSQANATERSSAPTTREMVFSPGEDPIAGTVVTRSDLATPRPGPLVIEEKDTATVVPPAWTAGLDSTGTIVIDHVAAAGA
jgi:N-methylhydantoinase A